MDEETMVLLLRESIEKYDLRISSEDVGRTPLFVPCDGICILFKWSIKDMDGLR